MSVGSQIAKFIIDIFRFHKLKILTAVLAALIFFVLMFPFADLSDLVTEKISAATNNELFLTFENMDLSLLPTPRFKMLKVKAETNSFPALEAGVLSIQPSIASLLAFKAGFVTHAQDFLKGEVELVLKEGGKNENKVVPYKVTLKADKIELGELKKLLNSPLPLKGKVDLQLDANVDFTFTDQPDGDLSIESKNVVMPDTNLPTPFGDLPFPKMTFTKVLLKCRIVGGELILEEVDLGTEKDPVSMQVKGKFDVKINRVDGQLVPNFGAYDLKAKLVVRKGVEKTLELFLGFLDSYKKRNGDVDLYVFRAKGNDFFGPPAISALQKFE